MQLADQCHSHTVKTVARPEAVDQPELGTQQLCAAAQAGNGPGDNEAGQHAALHMDTIKAAGGHVIAHRPQLEAAAGPEQHIVHHKSHHHGDDKSPGKAHPGDYTGQLHQVVHRGGLGHTGVADPAGVQHAHKQGSHIVEHDGDDHLILAAADLQQAGDHAPDTAGQRTGQPRQQHTGKAGNAGEIRRNECGDGTHEKLAFTAQVEHTALVREAGTQGGEHQRCGLGKCRANIGLGAESSLEEVLHRVKGIGTQGRHNDSQDNGQQRDNKAAQRTF